MTYLPDVRINPGGWNSKLVVRNNGVDAVVDVEVKFYDQNGGLLATRGNTNLAGHGVWEVPLPGLSNFSGSVIVDASQDVAVVVENRKSGEATNYNGITPATALGNAGWGQAGTTVYAPALKYQLYGRSGRLYIQNTGFSTATVTPSFRAWDNGSSYSCSSFTIPPQGRYSYYPSFCGLPSGQLFGAKLTSTQPLAVVALEQNDSGASLASTSNAFSADDAQTDYVPLVKSGFYGNSSAIVVQNVGASSTTVNVRYYDRDSNWIWGDLYNLDVLSTHSFWVPNAVPAGKVASARIFSSPPRQDLVATACEISFPWGSQRMQYNGFLGGSNTVILPRIYKNKEDEGVTWTTGVQVQNLGSSTSNITIRYYRSDGYSHPNWVETPSVSVDRYRSWTFWQGAGSNPLPNDFVGSAVITSNQPIVAMVNVVNDGLGDASMSYSGFNR